VNNRKLRHQATGFRLQETQGAKTGSNPDLVTEHLPVPRESLLGKSDESEKHRFLHSQSSCSEWQPGQFRNRQELGSDLDFDQLCYKNPTAPTVNGNTV